MSYDPARVTGPGNWPSVDTFLSLNKFEKEKYSKCYLFASRVYAIIVALPQLQNLNVTSEVKWNTILARFQRTYPNESGSRIIKGSNFRSKLGRAYRAMRELIDQDQNGVQASVDEEPNTSELSSHPELDSDDEGERISKTGNESKVAKEAGGMKGADVKQGAVVAKGYGTKENKSLKVTISNEAEPGKTVQSPPTVPNDSASIIPQIEKVKTKTKTKSAAETSIVPYNMKAPRLKLSFGTGLQSSSYVVCKETGLLTMTTNCGKAKLHQVRQIGGKCIHCGRTPL